MFGTPAYMAPEVLFGQSSTPAVDVYSLGVVLHEILVKKRPHDATTLVEMIAQILEDAPVRVADPIGDLVEAMLARDPAKRPSLARVIGRLEPRRAARRWPIIAGAAIALAGGGTAAWALTRAHEPPPVAAPPAELAATLAISSSSSRTSMPPIGASCITSLARPRITMAISQTRAITWRRRSRSITTSAPRPCTPAQDEGAVRARDAGAGSVPDRRDRRGRDRGRAEGRDAAARRVRARASDASRSRAAAAARRADPWRIKRLCADTLQPAIFHAAWIVLRAQCRR